MSEDKIVQEVRKIRHEIENEYGNDFKEYYKHLKAFQKKLGKRLICLKPNRIPIIKKEIKDNYKSNNV